MGTWIRKSILPLLLLFFVSASCHAKNPETGFLDRTVSVHDVTYKFQVFVPDVWTPDKKWPVVLFLHGAGERGDDGLVQTDVGIGQAIRLGRQRFPAVVVMPQCSKEDWWPQPAMEDMAMKALAQSQEEFHGDSQRIYLTGLSMGGYGTWHLAGRYPGKFAAIVPICGGILAPHHGGDPATQDTAPYIDAAQKIGSHTPVWIFHGGADDTVPVTESQRMAAAMKALGGEIHYTEYPGVGHDSWDKAYAEPGLFTWMFSKYLADSKSK